MDFLQNIMTKLYWLVFIILCIVIMGLILLYATQVDNWSDKQYYHMMNIKRISLLAVVICGSLYMRYLGNIKISNIILFIPVLLTLLAVLGFFLIVFLFSNSGK
jgi:hypothetical protein